LELQADVEEEHQQMVNVPGLHSSTLSKRCLVSIFGAPVRLSGAKLATYRVALATPPVYAVDAFTPSLQDHSRFRQTKRSSSAAVRLKPSISNAKGTPEISVVANGVTNTAPTIVRRPTVTVISVVKSGVCVHHSPTQQSTSETE
jgi:hypothetical protein